MLQRIIGILFGVDPAPWTQGGGARVEFLALGSGDRVLILLVGVTLAAAGLIWLYRRDGRNLSGTPRAALTGLRGLAMLAALTMLLEPVLVFHREELKPSTLLLLVDESASMDLSDTPDAPRRKIVQELLSDAMLAQLEGNGDRVVRRLGFASGLLRDDAAAPRQATAVGDAMQQALALHRGEPLAGVLLLSDGQSNAGESPLRVAEQLGQMGVPVHVLAIGTEQGPRNARIASLEVAPLVFVRDDNSLTVVVESRGFAGAAAQLLLSERLDGGEWRDVETRPLTLGEGGELQRVSFTFRQDRPVAVDFKATLQNLGPDLDDADNLATASTRVIHQKVRTLFVAGHAFPEVQFVRNALLRDKAVDLSTWLLSADAKYTHPGHTPLRRLPATQEELNTYDCVLLYDPDPTLMGAGFGALLAPFVEQAGGGLVLVAGERWTAELFERAAEPGNEWVNLMPVVVEPGLFRSEVDVRLSAASPWRLEVTPTGRSDPLFRFDPDPAKNESILASLPGMFWHFPVTRARGGASVLAQHGDPRMRNAYGPQVLLATQFAGPGRTFFLGFDSTYRWRFLDEQHFDGFWARVVDRAGRTKQLGGRFPFALSTQRSEFAPGSSIQVQAQFLDVAAATGVAFLNAQVELGGQTVASTQLLPADEPGRFVGSFTAQSAGRHLLRVYTGDTGVGNPATLPIAVVRADPELERPTLDAASLRAVAQLSGGRCFTPDQAALVPEAFTMRRVSNILEDRHEVFAAPLLLALVFLPLIAEWWLRKRYRMV